MSLTQMIRKLKRAGILGDFVRVRRDGTIVIVARTPGEAYTNGNMLPAILHAYMKETGIKAN